MSAHPDPLRQVDYVVGGLRISLDPRSPTSGPRAHIVGFTQALDSSGRRSRLFLAGAQPGLRRLGRRPEGVGSTSPGRLRLLAADLVRVLAALWSMLQVWRWSAASDATVVYERTAVMQCLGPAHRRRRRALWIVESNGIFTRETSRDRSALGAVRVAGMVERAVYRRCDLVVAVSEALSDEICDFAQISPEKVFVMPNAVTEHVLRLPRPTVPATPVIGFAGTLVSWQQVDLLLRAFALAELGDRCRIQIVGDGAELGALRRETAELGLAGCVDFTGRLSADATIAAMAQWSAGYAGHVATSSATMYHSPIKLYEYAGLGLDVLATRSEDTDRLAASGIRIVQVDQPDVRSVRDALGRLADLPRRTDREIAAVRARVSADHSWSRRVESLEVRLRALAEIRFGSSTPRAAER